MNVGSLGHRIGSSLRRNPWLVAGGVVLSILAAVPWRVGNRVLHPVDDVYITLCYARSVASGYGFRIFPTAPPTLGTTTPLNALLLSIPARFAPGLDLGKVAVWWSVCAWLLTGFLWFWKGPALGLSRLESFVVAAIITVENPFPFLLGFEHKLFFLLLTASLVFWAEERLIACGLAIALATLTRAEGGLMLPAIAITEMAGLDFGGDRSRRAPPLERLKLLSIGLFPPLGLWALYAAVSIGQVLPATLAAKIAQVTTLQSHKPFLVGLAAVLQEDWATLPVVQLGLFSVSLWLLLAALGSSWALMRRRRLLPLGLWAVLFSGTYGIINAPFYPWYSTGVQYVVAVFAAVGIAAAAPALSEVTAHRASRLVGVAASLGGAAVTTWAVSGKVVPNANLEGGLPYLKLAAYLNENTPENSRIGFMEVGYLSWYTHRHIVDLLGLTDRTILPALFVAPRDLGPAFQMAQVNYYIENSLMPGGDSIRRSDEFSMYFYWQGHVESGDRSYDIWRRGPANRLPVGRTIEFGPDLKGEHWAGAETTSTGVTFQWMSSARSAVEFPSIAGSDVVVSVKVLQEIVPGLARDLTIRVDGEPARIHPVPAGAVPTFVLCTDPLRHFSGPSAYHRVELTVPRTAAPSEVDPQNGDNRQLGIAIEWIRVRPASEGCL